MKSGCSQRRFWGEASFEGFSVLRATYLDHRFALHSHDSWVIGTNLRGRSSCFADPARELAPGSLVVVEPGEPHAGRRLGDEPWVYLAAYPTRSFLREILEEVTGRPGLEPELPRTLENDPEMVERFVAAHRAFVCGDDPLIGESAMVDFLIDFVGRYCAPQAPSRRRHLDATIDRSIEYIRENLEEPLSLDDLARASGYSRFYFLRLFKKKTGQTPHAFVMQERVERAKELLKGGLPIASSAFDAGFADQPHLTRRFKKLVGVTPGEFVRGLPLADAARAVAHA